jgi:hypothetical protein
MTYIHGNAAAARSIASRRLRFAALLLCTVALPGCAGSTVSNSTVALSPAVAQPELEDSMYQRGKRNFQQGQYGLALAAFTTSLQMNPGAIREMNAIAACYDRMQRFDLADQYYQQALSVDPNSAVTLNNLGYSHLMRGEQASSLEEVSLAWSYFDKARAIDGSNPVVTANLSKASAFLAAAREDAVNDVASALEGPVKISEPTANDAWIERTSAKTVRIVTNPDTAVSDFARSAKLPIQIVSISAASHRDLLNVEPASPPVMIASSNDANATRDVHAAAPTQLVETATASIVADNTGDVIAGAPASTAAIVAVELTPQTTADTQAELTVPSLHAEIFGGDGCEVCVADLTFLKEPAPLGLAIGGEQFVQIAALPSSEFADGMIEGQIPSAEFRDMPAPYTSQSKKHAEGASAANVPTVDQPIDWFIDLVLAD